MRNTFMAVVLSCSGCMASGFPHTCPHPPPPSAVCGGVAFEDDSARRWRSPLFETTTAGYRAADGDHFVFFYWTDRHGRAALEYVVPASAAMAREVRVYDRAQGAHFAVETLDGGAWTVRGQPSSIVGCAPPAAIAARAAVP